MTADKARSLQSPQNASMSRIGGHRNGKGFASNDTSFFEPHSTFIVAIGNSMEASTADKKTIGDPMSPPQAISVSYFGKPEEIAGESIIFSEAAIQ
jgi:hypothetical protein